jgi:hypothetical protein
LGLWTGNVLTDAYLALIKWVIAFILLFFFPIGTIIGVIWLYFLWKDNKALNEQLDREEQSKDEKEIDGKNY